MVVEKEFRSFTALQVLQSLGAGPRLELESDPGTEPGPDVSIHIRVPISPNIMWAGLKQALAIAEKVLFMINTVLPLNM